MRTHPSVGVAVPEVLLPAASVDPGKWAVVACDQYTSQPEYWAEAARVAGDAPSTLHLIYPEAFLSEPEAEKAARIASIRETMTRYLGAGVLSAFEGFVYVERQAAGKTRRGLVVSLDLERYDYGRGSTTLVRATEGTIVDRIPPRARVRRGATLELPHILILVDDPGDTVLGPLAAARDRLRPLYDFDLMLGGGHLRGWLVDGALEEQAVSALAALAEPEAFCRRYNLPAGTPVLLYPVGDGNHSLATAKSIWEEEKAGRPASELPADHPRRYALVELTNVHDPALEFEPIHRVLFEVERDLVSALERFYPGQVTRVAVDSLEAMKARVKESVAGVHRVGLITAEGYAVLEVAPPRYGLPVATLQIFLDEFMKEHGAKEIDYVHGTDVVDGLGRKPGNVGLFLPAMDKHDLCRAVILDGALPRKTFSMGEADEKRFYMEARRIG